ncbi:acyltransferase [Aurantiacibacter sp. MUD11]|uniref:acyltransferase family protein n=1 Tax=Aurantiacibacter sp. MUD11 TaxID=3003265 RepID=UPI0022AB2FFB|nr:acyltransferase [Aurantiacibacter sp. MUD11]WAT19118.1 acyltransferase [Aurantiacibacter sp. MUD11]
MPNPTSGGDTLAEVSADAPARERFTVLDSWRGIAAMGVAWYHVKGVYWWLEGPLYQRLNYAVDFFFVLSGFVIAAAYGEKLRQGFPILKFMFLRYARLWPLHAFVIGLLLALEIAFWATGAFTDVAGREPFAARREWWTLPATLTLLQEYVHPGWKTWNTSAWSISVEVGLYLMAALLLRFFGRWGTVVALAIALAAGTSLLLRELVLPLTIMRGLVGFGLGMAAYEVWLRIRHLDLSRGVATIVELALVGAVLALLINGPKHLYADVLFALVVLAFAYERGWLSALLRRQAFVWLGTLSYSIYMLHGFVIGRTYDVLLVLQSITGWQLVMPTRAMNLLVLHPALGALVMAAMLGGTLVASYLTWRWIEDPARRWSKRKAAQWGAPEAEKRAPWK